jgi:hypothetical protein
MTSEQDQFATLYAEIRSYLCGIDYSTMCYTFSSTQLKTDNIKAVFDKQTGELKYIGII